MPRQSLTLVAQPPELPQLDLAQGRPAADEQRHALVTIVARIAKLAVVEPCEVLRQVRDELERRHSAPPRAGAVRRFVRAPTEFAQPFPDPGGQATRDLHEHLASTALGAVASEVNAEREARGTSW